MDCKSVWLGETRDNMMKRFATGAAGIPQIIWIMWFQGFDCAPDLVGKCLQSWQLHNRDWQVVLLHEKNYQSYVNLDDIVHPHGQSVSPQALSDILRINLLAKFGGVWVDATCFCCRPLDEWLGQYVTSGFFAFEQPARDRLLASWFLASATDCHLTNSYCKAVNSYWSRNRFPYQQKRVAGKIIKQIGRILGKNRCLASLWVHPLTARVLKLQPYFWFHYIFYRVVTRDEASGKIWSATPKISADIPHRLQQAGLLKPLSPAVKNHIDCRRDPVYKLNWRCATGMVPGCTLDYLLNQANGRSQEFAGGTEVDLDMNI